MSGLLCLGAQSAHAANFPLELTNIKAAGTGGMTSGNRIYRAYPGIVYNIRAALVGGAYPFTFTLSNAPAGMTINAQTGEINWTNPQATASPTITVVDSEGARVSATWGITVSTAGFKFVDAVNGSASGNGSVGSPWRTMSDIVNGAADSDIVYFRSGTYNVLNLPRTSVGTPWERVQWGGPNILIAYPGASPIINFGYQAGVENGPLIRLSGANTYIDGFETTNASIMGFQVESGDFSTFRRLRMHDLRVGGDGSNAAFIMTVTQPTPARNMVIQDSSFYNVAADSVTIKIYGQEKLLIENTVHYNAPVGIELKNDIRSFSVRGNTLHTITQAAIGGNMHTSTTNGEIVFNNSRGGVAVDLNQDGMAGQVFVQRNTLVGRVQVRNTDSADGPFRLSQNVIVNSDPGTPSGSHVYHLSVSDASRVVLLNNLVANPGDNMVDANGNLTAGYVNYIGTRGHMLGAGGGQTIAAPTNVRIVGS
ncbi:MAG: Ig domain-containing protein [Vicinamibacteraceae bacterium]